MFRGQTKRKGRNRDRGIGKKERERESLMEERENGGQS